MLRIGQRSWRPVRTGTADEAEMGQDIKVIMGLDTGQHLFQVPAFRLEYGPVLPEGSIVHIILAHEMDGAKDKVIMPFGRVDAQLLSIMRLHAKLHAPADLQAGDLQAVILPAICLQIIEKGLEACQWLVVHMICEADLFQPSVPGSKSQLEARIVAIEGDTGMDMKIKHLSLPPRTGGMPWAMPPPVGYFLP